MVDVLILLWTALTSLIRSDLICDKDSYGVDVVLIIVGAGTPIKIIDRFGIIRPLSLVPHEEGGRL